MPAASASGICSRLRWREAASPKWALRRASGQVAPARFTAAIRGALAAGAAGYIPKSTNPKIVVGALRLVAEGGTYVPPEALAGELDQSSIPALPSASPK